MALEVIDLISKHPTRRLEAEIEGIIPWLRKRSTLLQNQENGVLVDILKNCNYEKFTKDDIIIRQGERGDSFFVILSGIVSVYIDPRMTGEDELVVPDATPAKSKEKEKKKEKKTEDKEKEEQADGETKENDGDENKENERKDSEGDAELDNAKETKEVKPQKQINLTNLDRNKFGKFIVTYGPGKAFGEMALLKRDSLRNATIIADEDCDLLVIGQELYERSLKAEQEQEFQEISNFIEAHPFFNHMSTKFKKLLEMSLRKETFVFDTVMVRQGEPLIGLHFIIKGQATVTVEPHRHPKQYPHLWPFEAGIDIYSLEFEHLRESRRAAILRQYEDPSVWDIIPEELAIRRSEGYAAIEKWMKERHINLCSIHEGEVIGDTETLMNLTTNLYTIKCTANTDVFILDTKNFERLVGKRNVTTIDIMRDQVISKLNTRMDTKQGNLVPLLKYLHQKLTEQTLPTQKPLPPLKTSKNLPDKETQMRQMLEWFKDGKVELVNPTVPGGYYYKELMKEKARLRENARKKLAANTSITAKIRAQRKHKPVKQPRSLAAIRESLRQMMEAEVIAMNTKDKRKLKSKRKAHSQASSQLTSNVPSEVGSRDISRANSQRDSEPPYVPKSTAKTIENDNFVSVLKTKNEKKDSQDKQVSGKKTNLSTDVSKKDQDLPMIYEERTQEEIMLKQTSIEGKFDTNANVKWKGRNSQDSNFDSSANTKFKTRKKSKGENDLKLESRHKEKSTEHMNSDTFITDVANSNRLENVDTLINSKIVRKVQHDDDEDGPKRLILPPLTGGSNKNNDQNPSKWNIPMKFVNVRIQRRLADQLRDVPEDLDFLTSDSNLSVLENKIQAFHLKYGGNSKSHSNLPKLARFTDAQEEEDGPKGGGKVWVKKRSCRFADNTVKVKDHSHIRHYVVPELPQFEEVRRKKYVMQVLLDGAVQK